VSLRLKYRDVLYDIFPAGVVGVSMLFGSTAPRVAKSLQETANAADPQLCFPSP
jgi:hypothetical protein